QAEEALGGQLRVGVDGDPPRDTELTREIARGRHPRARPQRSLADRAAQLVLDLRSERPRAIAAHGEEQFERLTGLVRNRQSGSGVWTSEGSPYTHHPQRQGERDVWIHAL